MRISQIVGNIIKQILSEMYTYIPNVTLGGAASAWSQNVTHDIQTNNIEGKK